MTEKPSASLNGQQCAENVPGVLTEQQTVDFLIEKGFKAMQKFIPGKPILCVLPQKIKKSDERTICVARFDSPLFFTSFLLNNNGGQVDYFTIGEDRIPKRLYTNAPDRSFAIEKNRIFEVGESTLFEKGTLDTQ